MKNRFPHMKVVPESQWQKPLIGVCVIVIGLISLVIGFTQGERKAFADRAFKATLSADLEAAVLHIRELERRWKTQSFRPL